MKTRRRAPTKFGKVLLNLTMLNKKNLADCTGEDLAQFIETCALFATAAVSPRNSRGDILPVTPLGCALLSALYMRLAAKVGPKDKVGDVLSEQEVLRVIGMR